MHNTATTFRKLLRNRLWSRLLRIPLATRGPATNPEHYRQLSRNHREFGPREKPASWLDWLVFPSRRYEILRPDGEHEELLALLLPSIRRTDDGRTGLRGLGRTNCLCTGVPTRVLGPAVPQSQPLRFWSLQVPRLPGQRPVRAFQHLDRRA